MTLRNLSGPMRPLLSALAYIIPALLLSWFLGGQRAFGRIDAALAIPLIMPGALWLAWRLQTDAWASRLYVTGAALLGLMAAQIGLHAWLGGVPGLAQAMTNLAAGAIGCAVAGLTVGGIRSWRALWRWPVLLLVTLCWFGAGQLFLAYAYAPHVTQPALRLAVLTGLPLRWGGGDLAAMLAGGPQDASAVTELARRFDVRLIDSLTQVEDDEPLLVAHPRALAPAELVRLDGLTVRPRTIVILADALSSWELPHPMGDPRNPPVTSLLTPLFDHWGIALAAPDHRASGWEGDVDVFPGPAGQKLSLHSAGRFIRLPAHCDGHGGGRVARCAIGKATVWIVGDADLLHESLWQSPIVNARWLRTSDNLAWLGDVMQPAGAAFLDPLWIRS